MKIIGICSTNTNTNNLNYEQDQLYKAAQKKYDKVMLVNPRLVTYILSRGQSNPKIMYQDEDISNLSTLIVRSTTNSEAAIAILVRTLKICGCDIFDPISRFSVGKASKLLTSISRFQKVIGSSTYICFTRTNAMKLLDQLNTENRFPLIAKPISGKKGEGIELISDYSTGHKYIDWFYKDNEYNSEPFYLQDFIDFKKEYRVIVVDGEVIGIVEKIRASGMLVSNAAQGGQFIKAEAPDVMKFILENVSKEGTLGVDIAIDNDNNLHIIETNRAPQWHAFEVATNVNVATYIVEQAIKRLNVV